MLEKVVLLAFAVFVFSDLLFAQEDNGGKMFNDFVKQYSAAIFPKERDALIDQFWQSAVTRGIPYIADNKQDVVFLYRGDDSVRVHGDFTSWHFKMPMKRLPESNVWYLQLVFEPDARLDYKFILSKDKQIVDPLNPRTVPGPQGVRSELAMPDFTSPPELEQQSKIAKGTTSTISIGSKFLGYDHQVIVYLPPNYEKTSANPVVYFQDGKEYIEYARATTVLDNLIASGEIQSMIGVFVVPPAEEKRNRVTEYSMNERYERFVTAELIPLVDRKYRTQSTPEGRLVIGTSLGGVASLSLALSSTNIIANAASQSSILPFKRDTLIVAFRTATTRPRIYLGVGLYEKNVAGMDLLGSHRILNKVLEQRQFQYRYREFRDGHSWGRWRAELPNILRWFFPRQADEH